MQNIHHLALDMNGTLYSRGTFGEKRISRRNTPNLSHACTSACWNSTPTSKPVFARLGANPEANHPIKLPYPFLAPKLFATAFGLILCSTAFSAPKGEHLIGPTGITAEVGRNQIQVLTVDEESPASGKLKKGDVIVGAGDGKFSKDLREEIADAIEKAEGATLGGKLTLTLKGGR